MLGYQFRFISSISNKRPWKRDSTDDLLDITAKTTMGQSWDQTGSPSPTGRTKGAPTRSYACPSLHMDPSFCTNHPSHSESAWRHPSSPALVSIIRGVTLSLYLLPSPVYCISDELPPGIGYLSKCRDWVLPSPHRSWRGQAWWLQALPAL